MHVVRPSRQSPQKASADRHPSFALAFHEEARARHSELEARRQKQDRVLTQLLAGTSDARWTTVRSWRCLCLSSEGRFFHLQNEAGIGWLLDAAEVTPQPSMVSVVSRMPTMAVGYWAQHFVLHISHILRHFSFVTSRLPGRRGSGRGCRQCGQGMAAAEF